MAANTIVNRGRPCYPCIHHYISASLFLARKGAMVIQAAAVSRPLDQGYKTQPPQPPILPSPFNISYVYYSLKRVWLLFTACLMSTDFYTIISLPMLRGKLLPPSSEYKNGPNEQGLSYSSNEVQWVRRFLFRLEETGRTFLRNSKTSTGI
jgi:hypothetical protein